MVENSNLVKKLTNYESLEESNKELQQKLNDYEELKETIAKYETNDKNLEQIEKIYKEISEKQDKIIKELNQQFHDQTININDKFNKKLEKYIAVNVRQNEALKQIINLNFFDLLRNKHKKLANKSTEKLDSTIYELTPKK